MSISKYSENTRKTYVFGLIYGFIGVTLLAGARFIHWLNPPLPKCVFKSITGFPCPTCGATRSFEELSQFHIVNTFLMNPLVFLICIGGGLFAIYSFGVYFLKIPPISIHWNKKRNNVARILAIAAILINWAYLIIVHR